LPSSCMTPSANSPRWNSIVGSCMQRWWHDCSKQSGCPVVAAHVYKPCTCTYNTHHPPSTADTNLQDPWYPR
jgi:hypothetical protein